MSDNYPTEPGYYWAKLKTPSGGNLYCGGMVPNGIRIEPETDDEGSPCWVSHDWEIVQVNENDPYGDLGDPEYFSVDVFGIPVSQWPLDFFWGPKVQDRKP